MVEKCGGLPLAVAVLGGLLATKEEPREWRWVHDHLWRDLKKGSIHISSLLSLSFNDLSHHLELCFLYLGLFPEDFEIDKEKLIRLLVAEGLIPSPPDEKSTMEDEAQDLLFQLIDRSLILVGKRCWGKIVTLRVHDLLRDLAIEKGKELYFIHVYHQTKNSTSSSSATPCRRQALYLTTGDSSAQPLSPLSRSLFLNTWVEPSRRKQELISLCKRVKLSRVLNIEDSKAVPIVHFGEQIRLPEEIGRLVHLRYLGLKNFSIRSVPPSILKKLRRLQTLDLRDDVYNLTAKLPIEVCKLQELRHLIGNFREQLKIDDLMNLQTLNCVSLETWASVNTDRLVNLRKLHIKNLRDREKRLFTFHSISKLKNLQLLSVELEDNDSCFASLQPLSNCPNLEDLQLEGKIEKLPEEMHQVLPNLECLSLISSKLQDDPMPILEKLSYLVNLELSNPYVGKKMVCTKNGFPQLQFLTLEATTVEELQVEEGGMPKLRGLSLPNTYGFTTSERLRSIPLPPKGELDSSYWSLFR